MAKQKTTIERETKAIIYTSAGIMLIIMASYMVTQQMNSIIGKIALQLLTVVIVLPMFIIVVLNAIIIIQIQIEKYKQHNENTKRL